MKAIRFLSALFVIALFCSFSSDNGSHRKSEQVTICVNEVKIVDKNLLSTIEGMVLPYLHKWEPDKSDCIIIFKEISYYGKPLVIMNIYPKSWLTRREINSSLKDMAIIDGYRFLFASKNNIFDRSFVYYFPQKKENLSFEVKYDFSGGDRCEWVFLIYDGVLVEYLHPPIPTDE